MRMPGEYRRLARGSGPELETDERGDAILEATARNVESQVEVHEDVRGNVDLHPRGTRKRIDGPGAKRDVLKRPARAVGHERLRAEQRRIKDVLPEEIDGEADAIVHAHVRAYNVQQLIGQVALEVPTHVVREHAAAVPLPRDVRAWRQAAKARGQCGKRLDAKRAGSE